MFDKMYVMKITKKYAMAIIIGESCVDRFTLTDFNNVLGTK